MSYLLDLCTSKQKVTQDAKVAWERHSRINAVRSPACLAIALNEIVLDYEMYFTHKSGFQVIYMSDSLIKTSVAITSYLTYLDKSIVPDTQGHEVNPYLLRIFVDNMYDEPEQCTVEHLKSERMQTFLLELALFSEQVCQDVVMTKFNWSIQQTDRVMRLMVEYLSKPVIKRVK